MRPAKNILLAMGAALVSLGFATRASAYCAVCRESLLNSPEGQQLVAGFRSGILFLLATPFVISGIVVFLLLKGSRHRTVSLSADAPLQKERELSVARENGWGKCAADPTSDSGLLGLGK